MHRLHFKIPIITVLLALAAFFLSATPALACDITVTPSQASNMVGETLTFSVEVKLTHRTCIVPIEETQIILEKMELLRQTQWEEVESGTYQLLVTVRLLSEGEGSITVIRECIKGGDTATVKVIIADGGTGISPLSPPATTYPPAEINLPIEPSPTTEISWWQAFSGAISQPFSIAYLALMGVATIGFIRGWRRLRFVSLAFSLVYLGFFLGLCPCALGSLQNVILHASDPKTYMVHYLIVGIPFVSTMFIGRLFCGWICPMGAIQQLLYRRDRAIKIPPRVHNILKYVKYLVLVALVATVVATGTVVWDQVDPFKSLFNMEVSLIPTTLLVLTLIASLFIFSPWCRYICPLGAFLSVVSRFSYLKLNVGESCKNCNACQKVFCEYSAINKGEKRPALSALDCSRCGECLARCPKDSIELEANPIFGKRPELIAPLGKEPPLVRKPV
jgi:Pyruvate/2-oxoacid:ferredoxin oxidoreductase delta subunit